MTIGSTPAAATVDSRLSVWLSYGVLLAGLGAAVASAYIVISTYSPLPHWDEWSLFDHLATGNGWSWAWLWAQHNEHRILVPKIFFLLDVQLFHGTQTFLLASIFLIQLLQAGLLSYSLWTLGGMRGSVWRTGTGLIAYCILCPTQQENLIWGFQLQFVVPAAMATLAVLSLLLRYRNSAENKIAESSLLLPLAAAAATVATWSLANGMLLWPLLLLTALLLRMRHSVSLVLALCAAANISLYLYHYHRSSPQNGIVPSFPAMGGILRYVAVYFGSTWVRHSSGLVAVVVGAAGVCAGLAIIASVVLQRGTRSLFLLELSLLMLFCLATAAITASGRLYLGLEQATASRYQTFALLFWCSLGLALLFYASRSRTQWYILSTFLLALMLGFATQVRLPLIDAQWHQLRLRLVSLALLTGVQDPATLAEAYPDPRAVLRSSEYMKQHRLSIFAGDLYSQVGQPLDAMYRIRPASECSGYVSSSQVVSADDGQGLRMTGYAWDNRLNRPARTIVATVDGRISGLGSTLAIPMSFPATSQQADPARFGWIAFVHDMYATSSVELYAVVGKDSLDVCPFAQASFQPPTW
jgi:hypothetical protein